MKTPLFDENTVLSLARSCFYSIPEQWNKSNLFSLSRLPDYRQFDVLYDCFLANEELFFKFLDYPKDEKPDDYYSEEERVFNYLEYLDIFLAYYILRINGIKIFTQPNLERTDELIDFVTGYLFEGERILLSEKTVSLLRDAINLEKEEWRARVKYVVFLTKVFVAINNNDAENKILDESALPENRYHIKRIIYRKTHEQFDGADFLLNRLSFDLWEHIDSFETKIPDIVLFENFAKKVFKLKRNPKVVMDASSQLGRMADSSSFLSRVAQSGDDDCKQIQQSVLLDLYNRAAGESLPALFEFRIFLEFSSMLKNAESEFFGNAVYLKAITEKCTRFLNSLKNIDTLNLISDEQIFWYDCANKAAWFLKSHYTHWKGVKLLLGAFRASKEVWVKPNLSCNDKLGSKNLACLIIRFFISKNDEELKQFRQEMADSLIDLLKPAKQQNSESGINGEDFDLRYTELAAHWRYAYIRALGDLAVSVDGRGHYLYAVLDMCADNDPDPDVRLAARRTSQKLKRLRDGVKKGNHTRHLYEAFWWLRQAHLISLGQEVNRADALKVRVNEWCPDR